MATLLRRSTLLGSGVSGLALLWYTSRSGITEKKNIAYCNSVSEVMGSFDNCRHVHRRNYM